MHFKIYFMKPYNQVKMCSCLIFFSSVKRFFIYCTGPKFVETAWLFSSKSKGASAMLWYS